MVPGLAGGAFRACACFVGIYSQKLARALIERQNEGENDTEALARAPFSLPRLAL